MSSTSNPTTPSPGRKPPHCRKCGCPMKGHPKLLDCSTPQNCAINTPPSDSGTGKQFALVRKLKSLQLSPEDLTYISATPKPSSKGRCLRENTVEKADTLLSLSFADKNALGDLKLPGMFKTDSIDGDTVAAGSGIRQWLETVSVSDLHVNGIQYSAQRTCPNKNSTHEEDDDDVASVASTAKPLGRMSSVEERANFIALLEGKSKKPVAQVFTVDMSEIKGIQENAKKLKLYARIIAPKYVDGLMGDGWLVIGQDEAHVESLYKKICKHVKSSNTVSTAIKGGAVGAVTTWLCLAYS